VKFTLTSHRQTYNNLSPIPALLPKLAWQRPYALSTYHVVLPCLARYSPCLGNYRLQRRPFRDCG